MWSSKICFGGYGSCFIGDGYRRTVPTANTSGVHLLPLDPVPKEIAHNIKFLELAEMTNNYVFVQRACNIASDDAACLPRPHLHLVSSVSSSATAPRFPVRRCHSFRCTSFFAINNSSIAVPLSSAASLSLYFPHTTSGPLFGTDPQGSYAS